ncbi:MAG: M16 family metallopeptidase [Phycisphaerales bacterium]
MNFQKAVLPNGLTIIAEVDPSAHSAAAGFFVKTGARDEASAVMGVSHYLEHMMFKGTEDINAEELNRRFDRLGARSNAFTSTEMTCFYAHVIPEHLSESVDLLARMLRPALRTTDFDTEKGVILEEIAMYKDNPFWVLYEACIESHFAGTPLAHRVLGTNETITDLTASQMRTYFEDRYSADNTVLALAGKLDFSRIVEQVTKLCGSWKRTGARRDATHARTTPGELTLHDEKITRGYILTIADAPAFTDERRYDAALLAMLLGAPDNSLLHWALIEPGLADEAQASFSAHDGHGDYVLFATADPERLDTVWDKAKEQLDRVAQTATTRDLERLRNKLATSATIGAERPGDRMHRLGANWLYLNEYIPIEDELERIGRVTLDSIRQTARDFPLAPTTIGRLLPA